MITDHTLISFVCRSADVDKQQTEGNEMSFIKDALEACNGCNSSSQTTVDSWTGTGKSDRNVDTGVTYNDGRGVKDTVLISGPLSHAYTKALLIALRKQPLQEEDEAAPVEEQVVDTTEEEDESKILGSRKTEIGLATESAQQEDENDFFMSARVNDNLKDVAFLANKFDFIEAKDLPINVVCKTTLITLSEFMRPQNLVKYTDERKSSTIDHVVVVLSDSLGRTKHTTTERKLVQIETDNILTSDTNQLNDFNHSVENFVTPAGYKVIIGMESYFAYLKNLSAELCI